MGRLRSEARRLADSAVEQKLVDASAKAFNDAGTTFFQLANRALKATNDAEPRDGTGMLAESTNFFRGLGQLWLNATFPTDMTTTGAATTDRVRDLELPGVRVPGPDGGEVPTWRTVSILNRTERELDATIVKADLTGADGKIDESYVFVDPDPLQLVPGRTPVRVAVLVPRDTPSGRYRGLLTIAAGPIDASIVVSVDVGRPADSGS
jgi:hypothetical protein